jgi:transposase
MRQLRQAHRHMEKAEFDSAATIFERLARKARDRGMLRQAPRLYLQAGKAHVLAGHPGRGQDVLQQGLDILAETERWPALDQAGQRVIDELESWGHDEIAETFKAWLKEALPDDKDVYQRPARALRRPALPLKCPSCGGPLRPEEVEWLDHVTAACPYCGGSVRAERA